MKQVINTSLAPAAIGTYSQAVKAGNMVYLSGQIPLVPGTMQMAGGDLKNQIRQILNNIKAIVTVAGGSLAQVVKLTIYLLDMNDFPIINEVMMEYFEEPYPARAVIGVAALPKGAAVEIDAIMELIE